ncbi:7TM domain-containing protein [Rhodohalobacter sp. 8-1]|uniref:7TM domain-containing protein n=1 Tax=Rhodohalobacter sp. 8-1 TaxID=3131972 RepID=UPI0030EC3490
MKKIAYILILIPAFLVILRYYANDEPDPGVISELTYDVTYRYDIRGDDNYYNIESFLPLTDFRQDIDVAPSALLSSDLMQSDRDANRLMIWRGAVARDTIISFQYSVKTKHVNFDIDQMLTTGESAPADQQQYLKSSNTIQAGHEEIRESSDRFLLDSSDSVKDLADNLFGYVEQIPTVRNGTATDALACHRIKACSEEGKSRLLTALFRSAGIPAREAGGLVLTEEKKGTIDYWMQAYIGDKWVSFDPERNHFAELPATHLELFRGDRDIVTYADKGNINSFYDIKRERQNDYTAFSLFDIWKLIDDEKLPFRPVMVLLLLPLGAYIVAISTNVVGFKTYGVFLPVLIAFSFLDMGLIQGLIFFTVIIGLISFMSFPLERWGILHTPKIVCLLTVVSLYCLSAVEIFYITGWVAPSATLTFPIIILTLISERFAQKVEEESLKDALLVYGQTIIVTLSCFWILSASVIQHFFITFPETLMAIAGFSLLLGEWIGLQLFEYTRFSKIDGEVSYVK